MASYRDRIDTSSCYFCSSTTDIEVHHIIPSSLGGSDREENLVAVCSECHKKLERLYNTRFWNELGLESPQQTTNTHVRCIVDGCVNDVVVKMQMSLGDISYFCEEHTSWRTEFGCVNGDRDKPLKNTVRERYHTYELEVDVPVTWYPDSITVGPDGLADDPTSQTLDDWLPDSQTIGV